MTETSGEIRALNTARGLAALMIVLLHAPAAFGVVELLPHASLGVDLFFVLSGFVIAHAYGPRIEGGMGLPRFAQLRMARLYPLILLATLAGFGLWAAKSVYFHLPIKRDAVLALPLNLAFCPAAPDANPQGLAFPFLLQAWSITWEVVMYLCYFFWRRHIGRGAWVVSLIGAATLIALAAIYGRLDGGWTTETFFIGGARAVFGFWTGVAIYQLKTSGPGPSLSQGYDRLLMGAGAGVAAVTLYYVIFVPHTYWWADALGVIVGAPVILAVLALRPQKWLESWLGDRLGEASYSLYMLHFIALELLGSVIRRLPDMSQAVHFGLGLAWLAVVVVGSWGVWRWVETPLRVWFSRASLLTIGHPGGGRGPDPKAVSASSVR